MYARSVASMFDMAINTHFVCAIVQANCKAFFTARVRDRLHVVLCLDPAGASFRERVRNFPSLGNYR